MPIGRTKEQKKMPRWTPNPFERKRRNEHKTMKLKKERKNMSAAIDKARGNIFK